MSGLPLLPQEIQREIVRSRINSIIATACRTSNQYDYNHRNTLTMAYAAVRLILNLRYISKATAREVMFVCLGRLEKIGSIPGHMCFFSDSLYFEQFILIDCVYGWLHICPDDDFLLSRAHKTLKECEIDLAFRTRIKETIDLLYSYERPHTVTSINSVR